jgi:hypothetical protein
VAVDRTRLLHGPYIAPPLHRGDHAVCLYRDSEVVVTSWSDARIPWPRCRRAGHRAGTGLLVNEELARAIRFESSLALQHWFGVSVITVWAWRKALGVARFNEGSARLHTEGNRRKGAALRGKRLPAEQVERRRQMALALNLGRNLPAGYHGPWWTAKELALLGTMPDGELAARIGRTLGAVRVMRTRLGIPTALDRRQRQ